MLVHFLFILFSDAWTGEVVGVFQQEYITEGGVETLLVIADHEGRGVAVAEVLEAVESATLIGITLHSNGAILSCRRLYLLMSFRILYRLNGHFVYVIVDDVVYIIINSDFLPTVHLYSIHLL